MNEKTGFPLSWPDGRARFPMLDRRHAAFKTSFTAARNQLIREIQLLGGSDLIISSNIRRRNDGLPYADEKPVNGDAGIAVYFTRKGRQMCFACDRWLTVDDNMHAISLTVGALRGIARWGTGDMMEAAFRGYAALPERAGGVSWWDVLGVPVNASDEQITGAYRAKAMIAHPDKGGSDEAMAALNAAYRAATQQRVKV
jgi:hypothetical protein